MAANTFHFHATLKLNLIMACASNVQLKDVIKWVIGQMQIKTKEDCF